MRDRDSPSIGDTRHRRSVLAGTAVAGLAALAGCLNDSTGDADAPDPIDVAPDRTCDNCTMRIGDFTGSAGQAFYDDPTALLDADRPAQFCSSQCTYTFTFDHESDQEPLESYLTDYSTVEWQVDAGGEVPTISRHLAADTFAPASTLSFVVDSDIHGAHGPSLLGFSNDDDAESFQDEYGGDLYDHGEISRELLQSLMG